MMKASLSFTAGSRGAVFVLPEVGKFYFEKMEILNDKLKGYARLKGTTNGR